MMSNLSKQFYLDKRNAKFLGVCAGIADYFNVDRLLVRIGTVLVTILISGLPIIAYFVIAWLAEAKPNGY
jgi:phage shock protein C